MSWQYGTTPQSYIYEPVLEEVSVGSCLAEPKHTVDYNQVLRWKEHSVEAGDVRLILNFDLVVDCWGRFVVGQESVVNVSLSADFGQSYEPFAPTVAQLVQMVAF